MDDADRAAEDSLIYDELRNKQFYELPKGEPGECKECGTDHPRLVNGLCPFCRETLEKLRARRLGR